MPAPLTSNEATDMANTVYNEAIKARQMGVYLDDNQTIRKPQRNGT
jgi:hypothetical protein